MNRDGGLPASRFFAKVQPRLGVPLNALYLTVVLVVIFGLIFLGSTRYAGDQDTDMVASDYANMFTSAFNAIVSASVVLLGVAYAIPIAINCMRGRKMLPPRPFELPPLLGWACNIVCGLSLISRLCAR